MIYLIIKSYLVILISIAAGCLIMLAVGLYLIFKTPAKRQVISLRKPAPFAPPAPVQSLAEKRLSQIQKQHRVATEPAETVTDLTAIAGDDVIATQLDLARAYIETGKKNLARTILKNVTEQGSHAQQQEAQRLSQLI